MKAICVICGRAVHPWQTRDGVCEDCVDPRSRALEEAAVAREGRARRWAERARRGRWWLGGAGVFALLIALSGGLFALLARGCSEASRPAVDHVMSGAGDPAAKHVAHGIEETLRAFSTLR